MAVWHSYHRQRDNYMQKIAAGWSWQGFGMELIGKFGCKYGKKTGEIRIGGDDDDF